MNKNMKICEIYNKLDGRCGFCGKKFDKICLTLTDMGEGLIVCKSCSSTKKSSSETKVRHTLNCRELGYPKISEEIIELLKEKDAYTKLFPEEYVFWYEKKNLYPCQQI